jgi:HEAT repeat protein
VAGDDLHRFVQNKNDILRCTAAYSLVSCYSHIPREYRKQAWNEWHRLTQDKIYFVRSAVTTIGSCYSLIPEEYRQQTWDDLHRLTQDKNDYVRRDAANALGSCYSHIPEEYIRQAWDDLDRLTKDEDKNIRVDANQSSGRVSIYRASQGKDDESVRKELEIAIRFFEKASNESGFSNPAKFCLPFYRSFYTITFRKEEAEADVKKFISEAKSALEGSVSKKNLLEVVENLGNALKEARDSNDLKADLNTYRRYCDRACELLITTEEMAPGASKLIRRGLPIIDGRIKDIILEIQEKASIACHQSKGTKVEEIACAANCEIQKWQIGDQEQMTQNVENLIFVLSLKVPSTPEFKYIHNEIEQIRMELDITKQYQKISYLIALIPTSVHIGDDINQNVSGNNNQVIGKVNGNNGTDEKKSSINSKPIKRKTVIDWINPPATIAAFVGFISVEIGTYFYPITYNHIIGAVIALLVFIIVAIFSKH